VPAGLAAGASFLQKIMAGGVAVSSFADWQILTVPYIPGGKRGDPVPLAQVMRLYSNLAKPRYEAILVKSPIERSEKSLTAIRFHAK
jgi:hypothetical protein